MLSRALPVSGMPAELVAALDARLAARRPRTTLTLAEHVARLRGRWPLSREEALRLGYPPAEVLKEFGPEKPEGCIADSGLQVTRADGKVHVTWGRNSVVLPAGAGAREIEAALLGMEAGIHQLAAALERAVNVVAPPRAREPFL
ncbi:hypothetical protein [Azospirillum sp. sgz302134]